MLGCRIVSSRRLGRLVSLLIAELAAVCTCIRSGTEATCFLYLHPFYASALDGIDCSLGLLSESRAVFLAAMFALVILS